MIAATFIKQIQGWTGDARLYKLSESVPYGYDEESVDKTDHVIVSAVVAISGPETYIFPARSDGTTLKMTEMEGSLKGGLDHAAAILNAGWDLAAQTST